MEGEAEHGGWGGGITHEQGAHGASHDGFHVRAAVGVVVVLQLLSRSQRRRGGDGVG